MCRVCVPPKTIAPVIPLPGGEASIQALPGCLYHTTMSRASVAAPACQPVHKAAAVMTVKRLREDKSACIAFFGGSRRQQCPDKNREGALTVALNSCDFLTIGSPMVRLIPESLN